MTRNRLISASNNYCTLCVNYYSTCHFSYLQYCEHKICRALGCVKTSVAYGGTFGGKTFTDFPGTDPWPCGVDITEIRIYHHNIINGIQVTYRTVDGESVQKPRRGRAAGRVSVVRLETGERITGVMGVVCRKTVISMFVTQLAFFSEKEDGQKVAYGPYGAGRLLMPPCKLFAVNGKVNSIFGRVSSSGTITGLAAIGFFYEDESRSIQDTE